MKIAYIDKKFSSASLEKIELCNTIIDEYAAQGFDLTLRQLFYQMVSRAYIANTDREYKNLGGLVNDARLAGLIDWDAIVDRVRNLRKRSSWQSPKSIIGSAAAGYHIDYWEQQDNYVEVWVEKNALIGVIDPVCTRWDVPYFACIGYNSQSEAWEAAQRVCNKIIRGKQVTVLHLGDHDPSGKDMTRDIEERFWLFLLQDYKRRTGHRLTDDLFTVKRIALNWDQIQLYNPPPNPAKLSDSRANAYIEEFGDESWELDALSPTVIDGLIEQEIIDLIDNDAWDAVIEREKGEKALLDKTAKNWEFVVRQLIGK